MNLDVASLPRTFAGAFHGIPSLASCYRFPSTIFVSHWKRWESRVGSAGVLETLKRAKDLINSFRILRQCYKPGCSWLMLTAVCSMCVQCVFDGSSSWLRVSRLFKLNWRWMFSAGAGWLSSIDPSADEKETKQLPEAKGLKACLASSKLVSNLESVSLPR